jgi:hypothetical protein
MLARACVARRAASNLDSDTEREGRDADGRAGMAALVAEGEHHEVRAAVDDLANYPQ